MSKTIDDSTVRVVGEIDELIKELEHLKTGVIATGDAAKAALDTHFTLGGEAMAFRDVVRQRIADITQIEQPE